MKPLGGLDALAGHIPAGSTVVVHSGCGELLALTAALADQSGDLRDVKVVTMMPMGQAPYAAPDKRGRVDVTTGEGDAIKRRIPDHVADLIRDGDVLQAGLGALPDLILARLAHRRDLGVHSGVITDASRPLIEAGVVTNARKADFRGLSVTTMAAGGRPFYDYLHDNPAISFQPCSLTHDVARLSTIQGLTAVDSVLEVDLSGAAKAEHIDGRRISAPGGLPDFARGARPTAAASSLCAPPPKTAALLAEPRAA